MTSSRMLVFGSSTSAVADDPELRSNTLMTMARRKSETFADRVLRGLLARNPRS